MRHSIFTFSGRVYAVSALVLSAALIFAGCTKEEPETIEEGSGISFGQTLLEIPPEGGEMTVAYFLEEPVEGLEIVPGASEEWVHDFDMSEEGKVSFIVDSTDVEVRDREAVLSLRYGEDSVGLRLVQKGAEAQIMMDVEFARNFSFVVKVVPKDPEMRVRLSVIDQDVMDAFASDEEFFESEMEAFKILAEHNEKTLEEFITSLYDGGIWYRVPPLSYVLLSGVQGLVDVESRLKPGKNYCVYCYGIDREGKPLTPVYKIPTSTTPLNNECDDVTLDMSVKVKKLSATFSVKPSDNTQTYYSHHANRHINEADVRYEAQMVMDKAVYMAYTHPDNVEAGNITGWEDIVAPMLMTGPTERTVNIDLANRECTAYAYCLDEMGNITSKGTVEYFTTEDINMSDNVITMDVSDVTFNSVKLSVSTTNQDTYFVLMDEDGGRYDNLSSDELIDSVLYSKTVTVVYSGMGDFEKELKDLDEKTEYIVVAYGFNAGKYTTEPFVEHFTTAERVVGEVECKLIIDKYFDVKDVCAEYPDEFAKYANVSSGVMVPIRAEISGEYEQFVYRFDFSETVANLSDTELVSYLDAIANGPLGTSETAEIMGAFFYDTDYTFFASVKDNNGNYGPVFRKEITFTEDRVSPIEELDLEGYVIK